MISRVFGSFLHWRIGNRVHFGFHRHGNCWRFFARPKRQPYFDGNCVWYSWWRFFVAVEW